MSYAEIDACMGITSGSRNARPARSVGDHSVSTASSIEVGFLPCVLDLESPAGHSNQVSHLASLSMVTSGVLKLCSCCGE